MISARNGCTSERAHRRRQRRPAKLEVSANDGGERRWRPDYWTALRQATKSTDQENEMSGESNNDTPLGAPAEVANRQQVVEAQLQWDDRKMATSFANVVNIQSTREQVDLFFGTNQTWNVTADRMLSIEL